MPTLFLSYSKKDQFFAELAEIKLREADIELWRDQGQLRPGDDWRGGIEEGIDGSIAVLAALSENSVTSSYVTYEWAYALGRRKVIIPVKLDNCSLHPRLAAIQYLDFSHPSARPWTAIAERVRAIETKQPLEPPPASLPAGQPADMKIVEAILEYLNVKGYQMVSFERIREQSWGHDLTDERLQKIVKGYSSIFRSAKLKGNKLGLAKVIP